MNVLILPADGVDEATKTATISDVAQLAHITGVLKSSVGDVLKIAKLGGQLGTGKIAYLDNGVCHLTEVVLCEPPPAKLGLTLVLALPRPKVLRRLMLDVSAFGVDRVILLNSARTDKSYWGSPLLGRLDEFILEGLQQGVDSVPPDVQLAKRFKPFVQDELPALMSDKPAYVFHPYADVAFNDSQVLPSAIIIGAEGGFVPYEIELLQSVGVQAMTLGRRILRTESAVSAVLGRWL